jgi:hypothetical protein
MRRSGSLALDAGWRGRSPAGPGCTVWPWRGHRDRWKISGRRRRASRFLRSNPSGLQSRLPTEPWSHLDCARWNAVGALDLVTEISLGLLSAPGTPFRIFTEGPGTLAMTAAPWIMIPTMIVPVYLLIHLAIAVKLRAAPRPTGALAMAA